MEYLVIGKVVNVQGLKGEIKIYTYTDDIDKLLNLDSVFLEKDNKEKEYIIEDAFTKGNLLILKLQGIDTVEQASTLRDYIVRRRRDDSEILEDDTYYISDLIACEVFTIENEFLGKVTDVLQNGAADVYVIKNKDKEVLLPAIKKVVKQIDIKNKKIVVEMMEGL